MAQLLLAQRVAEFRAVADEAHLHTKAGSDLPPLLLTQRASRQGCWHAKLLLCQVCCSLHRQQMCLSTAWGMRDHRALTAQQMNKRSKMPEIMVLTPPPYSRMAPARAPRESLSR